MIDTLHQWLIEPSDKVAKAEDRRQAKLLSGLLLLTILAVLAERVVGGNVPIWFLFVLIAGYGLSRTTYFQAAAVGSILMLSVPSFLAVITMEAPTSIRLMSAMIWLIVPILLSSVFLSEGKTVVIIGINMGGIILLPLLNPEITWPMIWGVFGFVATTGMIVLLVMHQRKASEEAVFLAELEANNAALQQEIAARQQTEAALRQSEEAARQFQQQLIVLQAVSIELTQAESFDELCRRAVELGRSQLNFDRLGIWFLDESDPRYMVGSFGTDEQGAVRDERHIRMPTGPAEVFDGESPSDIKMKSWRRNKLFDEEKRVVGEGWNVLAPLWRGDQVIGYIGADNLLGKRPFSPELLELLGLYATTLSQLIVRKQEETKAQQRREMLEKVVELGKYVTQVADLRECLLRIYQSVKTGLNFDRVGLFLYDESNQLLLGTFGTDKVGNLREEWDLKLAVTKLSASGQPLHMADQVLFTRDFVKTYSSEIEEIDEEMKEVKQHVRVVSWVGELPVAVINADNLVTQRPITDEQVEALNLFAGYAGLAIENARLLTQVKEAEQRYRSIFENAVEGIFQTAPEGYFLRANPAVAHMLGYDSPEQLIASITDIGNQIYIDIAQREAMGQQLAAQRPIQNFEVQIKRRDGSHAWLSLNIQIVPDDKGRPLYYEGTAQDVTHRKQADEERERLIQELEVRNEELERFTYTVSHDLKSPLITIQGFLGFVERDAHAGNLDGLKADIERITQATQRMRQLLDELLELSRVGRLVNPSEAVPFADLVQEALTLVSGRLMPNAIQVNVAQALPAVFVDRRRLVEVLQNLLDNAAKFMGEQPSPQIDIGTRTDNAETIFFVRDNGVGIPLKYQETVFGLFERLDQSVEGTGIGLTLVKRIIEVHNGRLWVESAGKGQGTTFYFTLPLADGEPSA